MTCRQAPANLVIAFIKSGRGTGPVTPRQPAPQGGQGANARFDEPEEDGLPYVEGLRCRECGHPYPAEALHVCEWCFGPLEVVYDYEAIRKVVSRERIEAGPLSIWRYADL